MVNWRALGYNIPVGSDGFPVPGLVIQFYRRKAGLTQEHLAYELGVSRTMVTRMENENLGLDSLITRRKLMELLAIPGLLFGMAELDTLTKVSLIDTQLLRNNITLYDEAFHMSNLGIGFLDDTIASIRTFAKQHGKNPELLSILAEYSILGLSVAREGNDTSTVQRYTKETLALVRELGDPVLLARTLTKVSSEFYARGDTKSAQRYAQETYTITNLPAYNRGMVLLDYGRAMSDTKAIDEAAKIADKLHSRKLTRSYCLLHMGSVLVDKGQYSAGLDALDAAESTASPSYTRRLGIIQMLQTRALLGLKQYDEATSSAQQALSTAKQTNSYPLIRKLTAVHADLKSSPYGSNREVAKLGAALV